MTTTRSRATGRGWVAAVVVILGATVALNFYVLRIASADPSFAVEPDYYRKALHWDDELAQRERNAALGWHASPTLGTAASGAGIVQVRLADAGGAPLRGATVRVSAFPIARSARVVGTTLAAADDGAYAAPLAIERAGAWEVRIEAVRGTDRFTSVHRLDVALAEPAP